MHPHNSTVGRHCTLRACVVGSIAPRHLGKAEPISVVWKFSISPAHPPSILKNPDNSGFKGVGSYSAFLAVFT